MNLIRCCPSQVRLKTSQGFTLIEVMIVVVILGILAAIVSQKFVSAFTESRTNAIQMNLHRMRSQLEIYQQHHNAYPTFANFVNQMSMATNATGNTAAVGTPGFPFGPYLRNVPPNPNTGANILGNGAVGTSDWFYDENTGEFHANDSATTFAF